MRVNPYILYNGNCAEAVALYEKAFSVKAEIEVAKNLVGHAEFKIGSDVIMLCDSEEAVKVGDNIMISIRFDENEKTLATEAFDILKEEGEVIMELGETSWSKCFGLLVDKFGIQWNMCQNYE